MKRHYRYTFDRVDPADPVRLEARLKAMPLPGSFEARIPLK